MKYNETGRIKPTLKELNTFTQKYKYMLTKSLHPQNNKNSWRTENKKFAKKSHNLQNTRKSQLGKENPVYNLVSCLFRNSMSQMYRFQLNDLLFFII